MFSNQSSIMINKLLNDNFHACKHLVELIFYLLVLNEYLDNTLPPSLDFSDCSTWLKRDLKSRAIFSLKLSDDHLKQVQHASLALTMCKLICVIFEKRTFLNKLAAWRKFYTASMSSDEMFCNSPRAFLNFQTPSSPWSFQLKKAKWKWQC